MMTRNATKTDFDRALSGVEFPASRDGIVRAASDKGGLDNEALFILENIPEGTYASRDELDRAIEDAYARTGGFEGGIPAAPAKGRQSDAAADTERAG
jgi:hypothetical protein